jgi:hypothetical protein
MLLCAELFLLNVNLEPKKLTYCAAEFLGYQRREMHLLGSTFSLV